MTRDIKEIQSITFGIYSSEEIINMSVCNVNSTQKEGTGSVYDPRMGTTNNREKCVTCKQLADKCHGHFGHVLLKEPIIHPLFYKQVMSFLKCFCITCHRTVFTEEQINLHGLNRFKGNSRFLKILERRKTNNICGQIIVDDDGEERICGTTQPGIRMNKNDNSISQVYINNDKTKINILMTVKDIENIFNNISISDLKLVGFNHKIMHPRNFIMRVLPVIPPCDRPFVKADGKICDDDLTTQYSEIVKINNALIDNKFDDNKKRKHIQSLKFRITTTFKNHKGKAKHSTSQRPIKCINSRINGKQGQMRFNGQGKRVNWSGRTVIGPEPTLKLNEVGIPPEMADILSIPERVTHLNIEKLRGLMKLNRILYVINSKGAIININRYNRGTHLNYGDVIHRDGKEITVKDKVTNLIPGDRLFRKGFEVEHLSFSGRIYEIKYGDVVARTLQDGDPLAFNRQPSLHKLSIMCFLVKIIKGRTLRFNLANTSSYNADFDKLSVENMRR